MVKLRTRSSWIPANTPKRHSSMYVRAGGAAEAKKSYSSRLSIKSVGSQAASPSSIKSSSRTQSGQIEDHRRYMGSGGLPAVLLQ